MIKLFIKVFCMSFFSVYFTFSFLTNTGNTDFGYFYYYQGDNLFWAEWSNLLVEHYHINIAFILDVLTIIIIFNLIFIHKQTQNDVNNLNFFDYFNTISCITFLPMAVVYFLIFKTSKFYNAVWDIWFAGKFTFFVIIHWMIVLFINFAYIILCRRKQSQI